MPKRIGKILIATCLFLGSKSTAQETIVDINNFLSDAIWYSDQFISPAGDAAIYQSSSGWVTTPQKKKLWDASLSVHTNVFFVPNSNKRFAINDSDFAFFDIENANSASVPTALGNDDQLYLVGHIRMGDEENEVRMKSPEGVDSETIVYPYLQGSLGLWYGTEIIGKYSYKVKLKKGKYQVYGAGIKHNLSQYFKKMEAKNFFFSVFAGYSEEQITFDFLNTKTNDFGTLGLNSITGFVETWQLQLNGSKKWGNFEAMGGIIGNVSDISYEVGGAPGEVEAILPVQDIINSRLGELSDTKSNIIGEVSGRYQFGHFFAQATFAFGKFANTNISLQYEL